MRSRAAGGARARKRLALVEPNRPVLLHHRVQLLYGNVEGRGQLLLLGLGRRRAGGTARDDLLGDLLEVLGRRAEGLGDQADRRPLWVLSGGGRARADGGAD